MPRKKRRKTPPNKCPICYAPLKRISAGETSEGKKYPAFWACKNQDCDYTWNPPRKKRGSSSRKGNYSSKGNLKKAFKAIRSDIRKVEDKVDKLQGDFNRLSDSLRGGGKAPDKTEEDEIEEEVDDVPF